jgi:Nitrous oxide-stimulated promoter
LFEYAQARLGKCPWGENKPVCAQCTIHCYRPDMREEVRKVMRYAGPKMLLRHPLLALDHLLHERKPAPTRPVRDASASAHPPHEDPDADNNPPLPRSDLRN